MTTGIKTPDGDYSGKLNQTATMGTGGGAGLANMGEAMAAAGVTLTTNNTDTVRTLGVESMAISTALASCEQPAGPLLFAVQGQIDRAIAERSARKLAARMAGDGKLIGEERLRDAIGAACHALVCWRAGVTVQRGVDGGDCLTPNTTGERLAARVAWRACVASLSDDTLGDSVPLAGGAEDDWLCAQALPSESRTERAARLWIERHAPQRQALLARRLANITGGRGRRAAAVDRVGNALALMLGGESMDNAATAAGFARRGRNSAAAGLLRAVRRLGLIGEAFTLPRRAKR